MLHLMPWQRQANAIVANINYRVRVCIEGVPDHAWQVETVAQLFPSPTYIEAEAEMLDAEKESGCFCLWVWTDDPNGIAKSGSIKIEEPAPASEDCAAYLGSSSLPVMPSGPVGTLKYEVLIHVDRVLDYSPLSDSPSYGSFQSGTSGIPDEELEVEWPVRYSFLWRLGFEDGRAPPRMSVHDRLGGRVRRLVDQIMYMQGNRGVTNES